jgi:hypothetical protein
MDKEAEVRSEEEYSPIKEDDLKTAEILKLSNAEAENMMDLPADQASEKLLNMWGARWQEIFIEDQSVDSFLPTVLEEVGEPPEELKGELRVVTGLPRIFSSTGKEMSRKKVLRKVDRRIIGIWSCQKKDWISTATYMLYWDKASLIQERAMNFYRVVELQREAKAREERERAEREAYEKLTPKEKLAYKRKQMAANNRKPKHH